MLTLTRKLSEKIRIGNNIVVEVVSIGRNEIRLGITAPREVEVHREEVFHRIQLERLGGRV